MRIAGHSNVKRHPRLAGFTLFEVIIVMAIAAVVFGTALYMISVPREEAQIRKAHKGVEDLALQARSFAYSYQQPFVLEIYAREVHLRPSVDYSDASESTFSEQEVEPRMQKPINSFDWPRIVAIPPEYDLSILRWNETSFKRIGGDMVERWIHEPNSPCEPVQIRLENVDGRSLLTRKYHPLTAKATDEELYIGDPE